MTQPTSSVVITVVLVVLAGVGASSMSTTAFVPKNPTPTENTQRTATTIPTSTTTTETTTTNGEPRIPSNTATTTVRQRQEQDADQLQAQVRVSRHETVISDMQIEVSFKVPASVKRLKFTSRLGETEVVSTTGFDLYPNGTLVWEKGVRSPTIQLTITPRKILQMRWPYVRVGATNNYLLSRTPNLTVQWRERGEQTRNTADLLRGQTDVGIQTSVQVIGSGVIGESYLYLGKYHRYTAQANEQTIELIVPDRAQLSASPNRLLDAYVAASNWLTFGKKTSPIRIFVGPKPTTGYISSSQDELFVADRYPVEMPNSSWIKEYITMETDISTDGSRLTFISGGITEYYARLFYYEVFGGADAPEQRLSENLYEFSDGYRGVTLSRPTYPPDYHHKGPAVLYALDQEIRSATDGQRTLMDVVVRLTEMQNVRLDDFKRIVREVSGESMDGWIDRYFTTEAFPSYAFSARSTSTIIDTPRTPENGDEVLPPTTTPDTGGPPTTSRLDAGDGSVGIQRLTIASRMDADGDGLASAVKLEGTVNTSIIERDAFSKGDLYVEDLVNGESVTNTSRSLYCLKISTSIP